MKKGEGVEVEPDDRIVAPAPSGEGRPAAVCTAVPIAHAAPAVTEARAPEAASSAAGVRLAWDNEEPSERVAESLLLLFLLVVLLLLSL